SELSNPTRRRRLIIGDYCFPQERFNDRRSATLGDGGHLRYRTERALANKKRRATPGIEQIRSGSYRVRRRHFDLRHPTCCRAMLDIGTKRLVIVTQPLGLHVDW